MARGTRYYFDTSGPEARVAWSSTYHPSTRDWKESAPAVVDQALLRRLFDPANRVEINSAVGAALWQHYPGFYSRFEITKEDSPAGRRVLIRKLVLRFSIESRGRTLLR
jgi:hypothetical protein